MKVRDLFASSFPSYSPEQIQEGVRENDKRYLSVLSALSIVSVPVHCQAWSTNQAHPTVESGIFLLASAFVMLFFLLSTLLIAGSLWISQPSVQEKN